MSALLTITSLMNDVHERNLRSSMKVLRIMEANYSLIPHPGGRNTFMELRASAFFDKNTVFREVQSIKLEDDS